MVGGCFSAPHLSLKFGEGLAMSSEQKKRSRGFTVIEIMIATVILSIAVIGAMRYRYYAAFDTRKADMRMASARVALLLCESWRGVKGDETYNPVNHLASELQMLDLSTGGDFLSPSGPSDFTRLGCYAILLNGVPCHVTMSWKDISSDLRALNIVVAWPSRASRIQSLDEISQLLAGGYKGGDRLSGYKFYKLTTYTEI
jgi:prepilin-type N-terminal cleavage/methylation domain-containing protein